LAAIEVKRDPANGTTDWIVEAQAFTAAFSDFAAKVGEPIQPVVPAPFNG
jgi:hypothetical protein